MCRKSNCTFFYSLIIEAGLLGILSSRTRFVFFFLSLIILIPEKVIVLEVDLKLRQSSGKNKWVEEVRHCTFKGIKLLVYKYCGFKLPYKLFVCITSYCIIWVWAIYNAISSSSPFSINYSASTFDSTLRANFEFFSLLNLWLLFKSGLLI